MYAMRLLTALIGFLTFIPALPAFAHCQIPCGIYDDELEFQAIEQHIATIEKSMAEIARLSALTPQDIHAVSRWSANKEAHAQKIQDSAAAYFLTQRVKTPKPEDSEDAFNAYVKSTTLLHQIMVAAMTCKQTVDPANAATLKDLVAQYKAHYFKDHGHPH
jgi:nickel superoxide dismutase